MAAAVPAVRRSSRPADREEVESLRAEVQSLRERLKESAEREQFTAKLVQSQRTLKDQLTQSEVRCVVGLLGCWVAGLLGFWIVVLLCCWFVGLFGC